MRILVVIFEGIPATDFEKVCTCREEDILKYSMSVPY